MTTSPSALPLAHAFLGELLAPAHVAEEPPYGLIGDGRRVLVHAQSVPFPTRPLHAVPILAIGEPADPAAVTRLASLLGLEASTIPNLTLLPLDGGDSRLLGEHFRVLLTDTIITDPTNTMLVVHPSPDLAGYARASAEAGRLRLAADGLINIMVPLPDWQFTRHSEDEPWRYTGNGDPAGQVTLLRTYLSAPILPL